MDVSDNSTSDSTSEYGSEFDIDLPSGEIIPYIGEPEVREGSLFPCNKMKVVVNKWITNYRILLLECGLNLQIKYYI